jgi:hypothetical protein
MRLFVCAAATAPLLFFGFPCAPAWAQVGEPQQVERPATVYYEAVEEAAEGDDGPFQLFPGDNFLNIYAGGWLNGGQTFNAHGNRTPGAARPVAFNTPSDGFVFNQMWGYIGRDVDTSEQVFDAGFRVDYVFGSDAPDTQAFGDNGWDFGWFSNNRQDYGSAIPQIYGEVAMNDLSIKVGHFYTIIGYEVVTAPDNFFYSHAYTMNYGEPFTHTGGLATYNLGDFITLYGGYTFGWDSGFDNFFKAGTFLGGVGLQLTDNIDLTWACNTGNMGNGTTLGGNVGNIYINSWVLNVALTENLQWIGQHDWATNWAMPGGASAQWYGLNNYLLYTINDNWSIGTRGEWFADPNGARVGNGNGDYFGMTGGVNWRPFGNFVLRPEMRFDWFAPYTTGKAFDFDPATGANTRNSIMTFAFDGILTF